MIYPLSHHIGVFIPSDLAKHQPALASHTAKRPPSILPTAGSKYVVDVITLELINIKSIIPKEHEIIPVTKRNNLPFAFMLQAISISHLQTHLYINECLIITSI